MRLLGNRASCRTTASITLAVTISIGLAAPGPAKSEFVVAGEGALALSSPTATGDVPQATAGAQASDTVYVAEVPAPQMVTGPVIPAGNVNFQAPLSPALSIGSSASSTATQTPELPISGSVTTSFQTPPAPPLTEPNSAPIPGGVSQTAVISTTVTAPLPTTRAVPRPAETIAIAVTTGSDKPNEIGRAHV